jgi:uncharacterized membrane protein
MESLDLLRGWIMVIMALDHVRDFFHQDVLLYDPTDLSKTTTAVFMTRWITHFCAPAFSFLAGAGAFLSLSRGKTKGELSYFLVTRGLWLVLLELTVMQFFWLFRFNLTEFGGITLWALGWSMVALAALIHLPLWGVAAVGIVIIIGHNLLDPLTPAHFGAFSAFWKVMHEGGPVAGSKLTIWIGYPLLPWIGLMAAGYAFGAIVRREREERRRMIFWLGAATTAAFVLLRALNIYGNPQPWTLQDRGAVFTFLSFLDCQKYPPSLLFILMTIGPALLALAAFDCDLSKLWRPIITFGRVPFFFYVLHIPLIHGLAVVFAYLRHGTAEWLFVMPPFFGPDAAAIYPKDYGYGLPAVYGFWLLTVLLLYPGCRWFAELKQRRRDAWLSYF